MGSTGMSPPRPHLAGGDSADGTESVVVFRGRDRHECSPNPDCRKARSSA